MIARLKFAILNMPPRDLLRYAPIVAILAVMPLLPLAYFTTRNPVYCASCHKKTHEPELWRQSEIHPKSVSCIDCHATSRGLILRNFSAQPARIDPNCLRCHELEDVKKIGSPGYEFKKNAQRIRIPHDVHIVEAGASCTDCHFNIVHDRAEHKTNRPTMESCINKCHASDAKDCRKCHPAGMVPPPVTRTLEVDTCGDCHADFLERAIKFGDREFRHGKHVQNGIMCGNCHSNTVKHGGLLIESKDCDRCHSLKKPETHTPEWLKSHGGVARSGSEACKTCHQERFCTACHGIEMPHKANWRTQHSSAGVASAATCSRCHSRDSCRSCHMNMTRSPHGTGWRASHGITAKSSREPCANCHTEKYCSNCHGLALPHPTGWLTRHGKAALSDSSSCARCHATGKKNDCAGCHKTEKPSSHTASFTKTHSQSAKQQPQLCYLCHSKSGCNDCHKTPMPHEAGWVMSHGSKGASFNKKSFCFNCHTERTCSACHDMTE